MIIKTIQPIIMCLLLLSTSVGATKHYWDLGVIIDKEENIIIQQEIDLSTITLAEGTKIDQDHIKAFHANNFIAPILHNLKYSKFENNDIIKKYNQFIFSLSTPETLNFIKRSFLNNEYNKFFSLYKQIKTNEIKKTENINSMYIQNLYRSNQFDIAMDILETISLDTITDELLLYKIKTNIQLRNFNKAQDEIKLFKNKFKDSDLLRYVDYEQRLLKNKHEN